MVAKAIHHNRAATVRKRRSLLLIDADPLLRWSIVSYLQKAFDIWVAETLNEGRDRLSKHFFDAVIFSKEGGLKVIQELESLARRQNQKVKIVRLITGAEERSHDPDILFLEKPFELTSLSMALGTEDS